MKIGDKIVKHRRIVLILALVLLIPAFMGYRATKINYDMLTYLPKDMDTVKGQNILMDDFNKGGFSIIVLENMKSGQVTKLKNDIKEVDHVTQIVNLQDVINPDMPTEMLPEKVASKLNNKNATLLGVFFDTSTSDEKTLEAVEQIREISNKDEE